MFASYYKHKDNIYIFLYPNYREYCNTPFFSLKVSIVIYSASRKSVIGQT